jgi:hypothetical protein
VRGSYELADRVLASRLPRRLSPAVFATSLQSRGRAGSSDDLAQTNVAQPAVGAASMGLFLTAAGFWGPARYGCRAQLR